MSDGSDRSIIDEKGRVFGLVNIVDVLVILLVLAIVVGGVAVVLSTDPTVVSVGEKPPDPVTPANQTSDTNVTSAVRYATLDFGRLPGYVSDRIEEGQQWPRAGTGDNVTITDVYLSGRFNDLTTVVVRARVNGTYNQTSEVFRYRGNPLRLGDSIPLATNDIRVGATVTALDDVGDSLSRTNTTVTVMSVESPQLVASIEVGDEYRVGGNAIAEITGVERQELNETIRERVYLDIRVLAIERGSTREFAGRALRIGKAIPFFTDRYQLGGEIVAIHDSDDG